MLRENDCNWKKRKQNLKPRILIWINFWKNDLFVWFTFSRFFIALLTLWASWFF